MKKISRIYVILCTLCLIACTDKDGETVEFLYKTTVYYAAQSERCILWNDPAIGIDWHYAGQPILSDKDSRGVLLAEAEVFP